MAQENQLRASLVIGRNLFGKGELQPNQLEAIATIKTSIGAIRSRVSSQASKGNRNRGRYGQVLDRPTQVFSIFGDRGQGKTSTLISLCAQLAEDESYLIAPVLEPELLLSGEPAFPSIACNLLLAARNALRVAPDSESKVPFEQAKMEKELVGFVEDFLARSSTGRTLLVETSASLESYAQRIANQNAVYLRTVDRFAEWLGRLLDRLQKDILIFPIDDVDICREHSEGLLEAVRMFLSHPRVVVVFTAELETIRRSIRNRLLAELPQVFTGGEASAPDKSEEAEPFLGFLGKARQQMLAQEFKADDEYAQQFLYKVAPLAYRVQLRGLRADERLTVSFSVPEVWRQAGEGARTTGLRLGAILAQAPLLCDAVSSGESASALEWATLEQSIRTNLGREEPDSFLARVSAWYPETFSPILRVLLNQTIYFENIVREYRDEVMTCLGEPDTGIETTQRDALSMEHGIQEASSVLQQKSGRQLGWPEWVCQIGDMTSRQQGILARLRQAEDVFVMRFLWGLAFNPDIEADRALFFDVTLQASAFDAADAAGFWHLTSSLSIGGSSTYGFRFYHFTRDGTKTYLRDASSSLINMLLEYAIQRQGSPWLVFEEWGFDVDLNDAIDVKRTALLRWLSSDHRKPSPENAACQALMESIQKSIHLELSIKTEDSYCVHFFPVSLGPPSFISSARDASNYYHNGLHSNEKKLIRRVVDDINSQYQRIYRIGEKAKDAEKLPRPSTQAVIGFEEDLSLRILGLTSFRVHFELVGLLTALLGREWTFGARRRGFHVRDDLHWLVIEDESVGPMMCAMLREAARPIEQRFQALLYVACLPMGTLLTTWKQSEAEHCNAGDVLRAVHDLLKEMDASFGANARRESGVGSFVIDYHNMIPPDLNAKKAEQRRWRVKDPAKPPVSIAGLDDTTAPHFARNGRRFAPRCDLQSQAERLPFLISILMAIQGNVSWGSANEAPAIWIELVRALPLRGIVKEMMDEMSHFEKAGIAAEASGEDKAGPKSRKRQRRRTPEVGGQRRR